jgi:large subunit ribosomal protein L24
MKQEFSTSWLSSSQPRKQRKYTFNAPLHIRHKFLSSHLSKDLRKKYGKRALPLRKGDEVLVMRGSFYKSKGKISQVDLKDSKVAIEGIQRTKKDGSKVNLYFYPSNLSIISLNLDDKRRLPSKETPSAKPETKEVKAEKKTKSK